MSVKCNRAARAVLVAACTSIALLGPASLSGHARSASDRDEIRVRITHLEADLQDAITRVEAVRARVARVQARMLETERAIEDLAGELLLRERRAVDVARELYKGGTAATLASVLSSSSLADVQRTIKYLETSGQTQTQVFERLAADQAVLEHRLDELDEDRAQALAAERRVADLQRQIESQLAGREEELAKLDAALARAAERVTEPVESVVSIPPPPPRRGRVPDWEAIAMCESGGRWHLDSTYDGGLQFHPNTWLAYGGGKYARYAWQASKTEQIAIAERVLASQGPGAWPVCFRWK